MPSTKSNPKLKSSWRFEAIGTQWVVETANKLDISVISAITHRIAAFDKIYSRFRDDSLVMHISENAGTYEFPHDAVDMIGLYRTLYDATSGAVTPLIGDSLVSLGYDKSYSLQSGPSASVPSWSDAMTWRGQELTTKNPITLDFGAVGKGYLVDEIAQILQSNGVAEFVIDASGDIRHYGNDRQTIGLENPFDTSMVIGTAILQNESLCASATNRRKWGEGLHHVIDGRTGKPTYDIVATWVIAKTTAIADGIATGLFFADPTDFAQIGSFEYVRLFADGRVEHSDNFVGELFI